MPPKAAPDEKAPKAEHKKHFEEFLKREENKKPKSGIYPKNDEAKP
jgi:hypothetical protein